MNQYFPLEQGVLRLTGSDRIAFLHGQCSNDVRGLVSGFCCQALVLNAKGQIEFEIRILRRADDLLIFCPSGLEQALFERLKRYIIFDDVQMQIVSQQYQLIHSTSQLEGAMASWAVNRGFGMGLDSLFEVAAIPNLESALRLENAKLARVKAGIPDVHQDDFLGLLPQECGLELAVSYKKGCYIGQEIMARLEARGNPRYELRQVRLQQAATRGEKIRLEAREVGQLGDVLPTEQGFMALAVLRRDLEVEAVLTTANGHVGVARV